MRVPAGFDGTEIIALAMRRRGIAGDPRAIAARAMAANPADSRQWADAAAREIEACLTTSANS